jgi:hypothetical protein
VREPAAGTTGAAGASLTLFSPTQLWIDVNNNAVTNQHRFYRVLPNQ